MWLHRFTVRLIVAVCEIAAAPLPDVPLTVTVALSGAFPPAHPVNRPIDPSTRSTTTTPRRRIPGICRRLTVKNKNMPANMANSPEVRPPGDSGPSLNSKSAGADASELAALKVRFDETVPPPGVTEFGENAHVTPEGKPEQDKLTG